MKMNYKVSAKQGGFTLIELIVVIVILGIMAATAIPQFIDMGTEARVAKMQAAAGSLKSAVAMAAAKSTAAGGTVTYPAATAVGALAGLTEDYEDSGAGVFTPDADHTTCSVTYNETTGVVTIQAAVATCG